MLFGTWHICHAWLCAILCAVAASNMGNCSCWSTLRLAQTTRPWQTTQARLAVGDVYPREEKNEAQGNSEHPKALKLENTRETYTSETCCPLLEKEKHFANSRSPFCKFLCGAGYPLAVFKNIAGLNCWVYERTIVLNSPLIRPCLGERMGLISTNLWLVALGCFGRDGSA